MHAGLCVSSVSSMSQLYSNTTENGVKRVSLCTE